MVRRGGQVEGAACALAAAACHRALRVRRILRRYRLPALPLDRPDLLQVMQDFRRAGLENGHGLRIFIVMGGAHDIGFDLVEFGPYGSQKIESFESHSTSRAELIMFA
jgi:hypothetical protein